MHDKIKKSKPRKAKVQKVKQKLFLNREAKNITTLQKACKSEIWRNENRLKPSADAYYSSQKTTAWEADALPAELLPHVY